MTDVCGLSRESKCGQNSSKVTKDNDGFIFLIICLFFFFIIKNSQITCVWNDQNALENVIRDAARPNTASHAYSFATSAARSVCVCPLATMATRLCALATTIGRPRKEDLNALKHAALRFQNLFLFIVTYFKFRFVVLSSQPL
ncbi:hypothetical protein WN944_005529 [Citrus x changshan-huyou]|uniref:Uncharacterized protein n=1 Tax=Citrus x changshan-huyou TaxID=2935761 RepID=A0AAP0M2D7_9ROSI